MGQWYANAFAKAFNMETDFDDNMTWTLHTPTYTPNRLTHAYVSDLTNELGTGGGYTAGGMSAGAVTRTITAANSWGVTRANSTAYNLGDVVIPATPNGFLYRATNAGTSAGAPPTFPTIIGQCVTDGGVTWENYGIGILVLAASTPASWASATFTNARYLVLSDRTAGAAAAQPLIGLADFGSGQNGGGGTFAVNPQNAALGFLHVPILG